jgi:hypothetical protein
MAQGTSTVWMQSAATEPGCASCLGADAAPACRALLAGKVCADPQLAGPQAQLQRVLQALNAEAVDTTSGRGIVDLQWVHALRIEHDQAELVLGFDPSCGPGQALSDRAFQTLRRLLPDTDVYVRHPG